jgi:hypothetical protein
MKIIKATYGNVDCTTQLQSKVKNNTLIIRATNDIVGDPSPGNVKELIVEMEIDGNVVKQSVKEHQLFVYPKTNKDRLGIFYSNNNTPAIYPAIRASLASIKKAAEDKADIYTCMWNREPENPFVEYIAWTQQSSHLNQLLQVMQLLYNAKQVNNYTYVSFLEHDVLYPEGYFDYPEFPEGEIHTNMNYIGINREGFQPRGQDDEPFHQMTMRVTDAIKHCEKALVNALVTNNGLIEPQDMTRKQWHSEHSAIHINHGRHFTSHYNIYRKTGLFKDDVYWGKHEQYLNLFS